MKISEMGNIMAVNMEENFKRNQDFITEMNTIKLDRQLQMRNQFRERQLALQIAKSRELFFWFSGFYITSVVWAVTWYKRKKTPIALSPLVPLSFIMAYQSDLAYGNKLHRIKAEAENILDYEPELLALPLGTPTPASIDVARLDTDEAKKSAKIKQYGVDLGKNISLPCLIKSDPLRKVMWLYGDDDPIEVTDYDVYPNGSLAITNAQLNDTGIYTCLLQGADNSKISVKLIVRTTPPALFNVRVHPSTILALILWEVKGTGGYPIIHFTAQYRLADANETWKPISPNHISPNCRQIEVYKLEPNTTYAFQVWARNHLGLGVVTEVEGTTLFSDQDKELARIFLTGLANFDTRVWLVAVSIVMGTFLVLSIGTCTLLYRECRVVEAVNTLLGTGS